MSDTHKQPNGPIVYVIDDDEAVREALANLLRSVAYDVVSLASPQEFLVTWSRRGYGCLVLDIGLPGINGLDFQQELIESGIAIPIVFITGNADVPSSVRGMKAGAVDFLPKPFDDVALLDAVATAVERDQVRHQNDIAVFDTIQRHATLTPREKEVMALVTKGLMNKQVAGELKLSEITVKVHRGTMMHKMAVHTLADLVRMADVLKDRGQTEERRATQRRSRL